MNAPLPRLFGHDPIALDRSMYAIVERRRQIDAYLDHRSEARWAAKMEAQGAPGDWEDYAADEMALASHCRRKVLRLGREVRSAGRIVRL